VQKIQGFFRRHLHHGHATPGSQAVERGASDRD
jgi:hypothetical protein